MVAIFTGSGVGFERGSGSVLGSLGLLGTGSMGRGGEQLFFNAATGNLMVSQRDEFLVGLGLDAAVSRTYNSLGDLSDDNHDNWRQGYDKHIVNLTGTANTAGSTVQRVSGDGSVITYTWDTAKSLYVATDGAGAYDTMAFNTSSRQWTWTDGDSQVREVYAEAGAYGSGAWNLSQQLDTDGNAVNFSYYGNGRLYQVTTADGSTLTYVWSGANSDRLDSVTTGYTDLATSTAKTLTRTSYTYDGNGRLATVRVDLSPNDNLLDTNANGTIEASEGYVTSYGYDGSGRVNLISQSDGSNIAVTYDGSGRVSTLVETASSGVTRTTGVTYGAGYTQVTDPLGLVTQLDYDASNQLTKITLPAAASGVAQQTIQFAYDGNGNVTSVTDALGNVTGYSNFDANGNAQTITDRLLNVTTRTYGAKNEILTETTTASDAGSGAAAHTVRFAYDAENHLRYRVGAEGFVTEFRYTGAGQLSHTIEYPEHFYDVSALGSGTALTEAQLDSWASGIADKSSIQISYNLYDARGNLVSSESYGIATTAGASSTAEGTSKSYFTYDQAGRLLSRHADNRSSETFIYDGMGRLTSSVDVNGATTTYVFNDAATTTTVSFANGLTQVSTYNKMGELISFAETATVSTQTVQLVGNGDMSQGTASWNASSATLSVVGGALRVTNALQSGSPGLAYQALTNLTVGKSYTLTYNSPGSTYASGHRVTIGTSPGVANVATNSGSITFTATASTMYVNLEAGGTAVGTYSDYDNISILDQQSGLPAATGTATYAYDKDGQLRWSQDATGRKSYFLYDGVGRKVADISSAGDVVEYRYDANNRLIATIAHGLRYTGSLTALDDPNVAANPASYLPASNASDLWSWNVYDKEGRVLQTIDGLGWTSTYEYDGAGRLVKSTGYVNNVATSLVTGFKTTPPTVVTLPTADAKDSVARNFYDKDGRLIGALDGEGYLSKVVYDKAGQKVSATNYYNATSAGLRASGTFNALFASITLDAAKDRTVNYVYDGQGQLRFVVGATNQVVETQYDSAGQATTAIAYANALAGGTSDFTYDNVKALVTAGGFASTSDRKSWTVYDSAGRAAYVIDAEGSVVANSFNAAGQLIKSTSFSVARSTTSLPTKATMDSWVTSNASAANDRTTRFYYDGAGVLRYTVDGEGYVSRTDVDAEGRVTKTSVWGNKLTVGDSTTIDILQGLVTSSGGTVAETLTAYDALGRVDTVTNAEGSITRFTYGANGLTSDQTIAWGTNDAATTHYVYDASGRVIETHGAYGSPEVSIVKQSFDGLGNVLTVTDANNKVTSFTYDHLGQVLTSTDPLNGAVTYQYDGFGQAVKVTDKRGNASYSYFDKLGRLVAMRDAEDYVTETSYTAFSQVLNVTRRYNKATGAAQVGVLPTVTAHAKDAVTSFEYDKRGLVTKTTDAEGYYEQYTLDAFGGRTGVRNKLGGTVTNTYDRRGLLVSETLPMSAYRADGTVQATSVTNKFEYDSRGNRTKMIEAFGLTEQRTTNYAYDKVNRLTSKTLDAVTTVSYGAFTAGSTAVTVTTTTGVIPTESYVYDAAGRLKQVTDAYGGRTVSFYDDLGRKTDEVGPLGTMTHWTYDANGNMLTARVYGDAVTVPLATATAPPSPINGTNYRETVYTYDFLNRLKTTSIASVLVGSWNGSNGVAPTTVTISNSIDYDAAGNVIRTTDANGNASYSYYDKLGRKTAQADAENYLTGWSYDAEGNVLGETRFATKYVGTPSLGGTPPTVTADSVNDRTTSFTYDRNGNRLAETRANVKIATVATLNGAITETTVSSTITYTYNGLGQVLTKQEAAGDTVGYTYDSTGRLIKESRASYSDQTSTTVTPTVEYLYNGLNNLSRTRQGGATVQAGDRITTYAYGAGGRLASVTDPAGGTHAYDYDAAGNLVRDSYTRTKSNGTTVDEGILYRRDLLGRVADQAIATKVSATNWTRGDYQTSSFNAYGDLASRGINGLTQESFSYNNRGLVEKTNSGDGVWRFFVYDANGNKTLTIEDENYSQDLSTKTISQVLGYLQPGSVPVGSTFVDGLNASIATYDKRGQALSSILTQRELSATGGKVTITASQTYNAFGETASQTDARGYTTDLTYNTMGRLIQKQLPLVNTTDTAGVVTSARPTLLFYYDASGRLVASKDGNSNLTSRTLLAGSGYGEAEALVTAEYHADSGIAKTFYDMFGDARILRNELNLDETHVYDAMGRLITQTHRGGLVDNFTYDLLGQRITHWNSFFGSGTKETTDYDLQGRVVSTKDFAADITTNSYTWSATIATALGTTGGWVQSTTQLGKTKSETSDIFGNVTTETDTGSHTKTNTYDKAGRLTNVSGSNGTYTTTLVHSYFNTGLVSQTVDTAGTGLNTITGTFAYDANGNRTAEKYAGTVYKSVSDASWNSYTSSTQTLQDATVTYDALGRLTDLTSNSSTGTTTIHQEYDLNSNIRRTQATSPNMVAGGSISTDKWFAYDAMNRMVTANGYLGSPTILISSDSDGTYMSYDVAGNRKTETRRVSEYEAEIHHTYYFNYSEQFTYDNDGNLISTYDEETGYTATTTRDLAGRVTAYTEKDSLNNFLQNRYSITYNARGQVTYDETSQKKGTDTYLNKVTNTYNATDGTLTSTVSDNYKNGSDSGALDTSMTNSYAWYDTGKTLHTDYDRDTGSSSNSIYTSDYVYDGLGRLQRTKINDGINRTVHFAMTADEQILLRDVNNSGPNDPEDHHIFIAGRQVAEYTSDDKKNIDNINYVQSIYDHMSTASGSSKFYHGGSSVAGAEVGTSTFTPLNPITAGTGTNASRYIVQSGDTLQGIAASLWGDSSLWYKLAESNGLGASSTLVEGQALSVPVGVVKNTNNASTFNPYDTARATGDLSPTTNKPPKSKKCGGFGMILIAVVAIAVTVVLTAGVASIATGATFGQSLGAVLGGQLASLTASGVAAAGTTAGTLGTLGAIGVAAAGAAAGSIVSQGIGIAAGLQDKFSWKSVGLAALSAGIGEGMGSSGVFDKMGIGGKIAGSPLLGNVTRGAITSAVTQGVSVAVNLQDKFDWAGVAAAGVAAGAGGAIGDSKFVKGLNLSKGGMKFLTSGASLIASGATRSLINGSDFGDNVLAGLPDVIGQTIGGFVQDGMASRQTMATPASKPGSTEATSEPTATTDGNAAGVGGPIEPTVIKGTTGERTFGENGSPLTDAVLDFSSDPAFLNNLAKTFGPEMVVKQMVEELQYGVVDIGKFQKVGNALEGYEVAAAASVDGAAVLVHNDDLQLMISEFKIQAASIDGYHGIHDVLNPLNSDMYVVKRGDTLSSIAGTRSSLTIGDLASLNGISDVNSIAVGQKLVVPKQAYLESSFAAYDAYQRLTTGAQYPAWHLTKSADVAASIATNGIDPDILGHDNRFGKGFYLAESFNTAVAEVAYHGGTPGGGVLFDVQRDKLMMLDLTNPDTAKAWGYRSTNDYKLTKPIGAKALAAGYNAIRFSSERGAGANLVILNNYNEILKPVKVIGR